MGGMRERRKNDFFVRDFLNLQSGKCVLRVNHVVITTREIDNLMYRRIMLMYRRSVTSKP